MTLLSPQTPKSKNTHVQNTLQSILLFSILIFLTISLLFFFSIFDDLLEFICKWILFIIIHKQHFNKSTKNYCLQRSIRTITKRGKEREREGEGLIMIICVETIKKKKKRQNLEKDKKKYKTELFDIS